jgi:hypothetical protein
VNVPQQFWPRLRGEYLLNIGITMYHPFLMMTK